MLTVTLALAQAPLAIPVTPDPSTAPMPPGAVRPSDRGIALGVYRQRAVSIRRYAVYASGSSVGWGVSAFGGGSPYLGVATVVGGPVLADERWAVFQGDRRLTVPQWLDTADAPDAREDLRVRLRRTRTWQHVSIGAAILGGVGMIATGVGGQTARDYEEAQLWRLGQLGSNVSLLVGIGGAFGTGVHGRTLRYDYDATQDLLDTRERVNRHNAALRDELGLDVEDTAAFDLGQR